MRKQVETLERVSYLSPRMFAEKVGVARSTVFSWIEQGKVEVRRFGDRVPRIVFREGGAPSVAAAKRGARR